MEKDNKHVFNQNISNTLDSLKNQSRFYRIETEQKLWFYDSFSHGLYSISKSLWNLVAENCDNVSRIFSELSLEELAKVIGFFSVIYKCKTDYVNPLEPDKKCSVMINTSNRCNLNCSYCYRNKNDISLNNIDTVKNTIDFAMKKYKLDASEYVISYSMTSESSVDLGLLKQIADEYINYENYQFTCDDIFSERFDEFYERLTDDLFPKIKKYNVQIKLPEKTKESVVEFLNALLELRNLYDLLQVTDRMFNDDAKYQIQKRDVCTKWKLYRINRWCIEVIYDYFVEKRHVPYVTFWFMSNGTCTSPEFIEFIKACDISPFWISIDGPEYIHNHNRRMNDGKGSYKTVVKNIDIFKKNGISLKASSVINSYFPRPLEIIRHLQKLGFSEAAMTPVRPGTESSFNMDNINQLLNGYDCIFEELKRNCLKDDFSLFRFLKEDLTLAAFNIFTGRTKLLKRCAFDDQIVVNSKGEIFPCLYFVDNKDFSYGNIYSEIETQKINHDILVNQRGKCADCWARYLCSGTCFYGSFVTTGNYTDIDPVECKLKKHLAEKCLELIVFLKENNISIERVY
jgi:radical SAM protein with 4Fe4S-binding SPASM domain